MPFGIIAHPLTAVALPLDQRCVSSTALANHGMRSTDEGPLIIARSTEGVRCQASAKGQACGLPSPKREDTIVRTLFAQRLSSTASPE